MEIEDFLLDEIYDDDGFRFSFEDMEKNGYKAYWVSLKLRTTKQKAVFSFIFDHPRCVVGDMREALDLAKDTIMPILRGFRERGLLIIEELPGEKARRYSINDDLVETLLESYRQRIYRMFPDVKQRQMKRMLEKAKQKRLREEKLKKQAEEAARAAEEGNVENPEEINKPDKPESEENSED